MAKNTTISLGSHFENFISSALSSGRYNSASDVIEAALLLLEEQEGKALALVDALKEGEQSGFVKDFNPDEFLIKLNKKHGF
jgi:antitoxin ParD1/3/4